MVNKQGHKFTETVAKQFADAGYQVHLELELTQLGVSKRLGLGDLDVIAWDKVSGLVYAVECKRLLTANSVRQVVQRLEDFRGSKNDKDSLGRHLRRVDWLNMNLDSVSKFTDIASKDILIAPLRVTSEIVPMQFYKEMNFPTSRVVPYDDLKEILKSN